MPRLHRTHRSHRRHGRTAASLAAGAVVVGLLTASSGVGQSSAQATDRATDQGGAQVTGQLPGDPHPDPAQRIPDGAAPPIAGQNTIPPHGNTPEAASAVPPASGATPMVRPPRVPGRPVPHEDSLVRLDPLGFWSWALLDRDTGAVVGSPNRASETSSTESMIKAWIGADYLAGLHESHQRPTDIELRWLHDMIHVSDDNAAEVLYERRGGNAVVRRMIQMCGLTNTSVVSGWWSKTEISAADAARMGACIVDRAPAGPEFTDLLLNEMRNVDPSNAFGIAESKPLKGKPLAVKNGWTARADGTWHLNCLAVWDRWSLAVLTRYPQRLGQDYGAATCRQVADQLFAPRLVPPVTPDF